MILYLNDKSEIHDVNSTKDLSLTPVYVDENNVLFPFKGLSVAAICCYKVVVNDGIITTASLYVDSRLLKPINTMGHQIDATAENNVVTTETVDGIMTDIIPELAEADANLTATIDSILTDIIPSIIGE